MVGGKKEGSVNRFKAIVFIFLLTGFIAACAGAPRQDSGTASDLAISSDWKDWRQPPPWSRR